LKKSARIVLNRLDAAFATDVHRLVVDYQFDWVAVFAQWRLRYGADPLIGNWLPIGGEETGQLDRQWRSRKRKRFSENCFGFDSW